MNAKMPNLFNYNLIKTQIQNHQIEMFEEKLKVIQGWKKSIQTNKGVNEKALQSAFLQGIFGKCLGYKTIGEGDEWNLSIEVSTEVDATTPDGILGFYSADESVTQAVIELKSPRHSLDKKQSRAGKDYGTPVDQAFSYASKYDRCSWVIVSNMNEIRLYKVGRSQEHYESFFIDGLDNEEELKKFHLLLCRDKLIRKDGESPTFVLSEKTKEHIQDISVSFYNLYKNIRIQLFEELKASNPGYDNSTLVEKAQKFLDRIIFICFCEDLGLLPNNLLHHAIQRGKDSYSDSEYVIWQEIKGVFRAIDTGSDKHNIPAYNGGLFAFDELLDNLSIKNDFFEAIYQISAYDFGTDLDVNILGHIFEQSIADIEELKADVQSEAYDPQKSRRKKDGIYYTPSYITKYIVENSLGKYLEDIRKELGEDDLPDLDEAATAQVEGRYIKKLRHFYQNYEERLKQVNVLDPACGSGAFLNQAFDFLLEEYRWIHNKLAELGEGQISIFDSEAYQRSVLQNNLYGVDLNEESVEITKLSLWLKTADSRNALPYLDDNIKCGNSLIDDPEVAGDKAFNWYEEFSGIMGEGGFDVVIGNPPYVEHKKLKGISTGLKNYETYSGTADIYVYFFEAGLNLLCDGGRLTYITSNKFIKTSYGLNLRRFLLKFKINGIIDFTEFHVFDALVASCIISISKVNITNNNIKVVFVSNESQVILNLNKYIESNGFFTPQDKLSEKIWQLGKSEILSLKEKIELQSVRLGDCGYIYRGVTTGYNPAFIIDRVQKDKLIKADGKSKNIIKPLLQGRNIRKWVYEKTDVFLIFTRRGINMDDYPAIKEYLLKHKDKLEPGLGRKPGRYKWHEIQDETAYYLEFEKEKIIWGLTAHRWAFAYDGGNHYLPSNGYLLTTNGFNLKYLLALMNSKLMEFYFRFIGIMTAGGAYTLKHETVAEFPIKAKGEENRLIKNVDNLLEYKGLLPQKKKLRLYELLLKYASYSNASLKISEIVNRSNFYNKLYSGNVQNFYKLHVTVNDNILTIYANKSNSGSYELLKIEVNDFYARQYIKLNIENLTDEQRAEINQYSGNILDKVLQITIPDYDKPEVVRKVVNEWNQLQNEIKELESKIEATDEEIDQMVYELYGLTEDEIKIVEKETQ